ncbi:MAG: DUF4394 domain-containing protein [Actinomycetota bacterium]|nr:DUF4394 domain-containing protein [Actinomycetota bacterium]
MRNTVLGTLAAVTAATALTLGPAATSYGDGGTSSREGSGSSGSYHDGLRVIGLSDGGTRLVRFSTDRPGYAYSIGAVSGLAGDTRLVGIDFRAADGRLYGLGNQGGIYTLDVTSARAARFGQLSVALEGTQFGVDVNPAADALRVVSNTGQNLRQAFSTPAGPTSVDGRLSTPPTAGDTTGVTGAAYTNNDTNPDTATTLFDISTGGDQVLVQAPANLGTLSPTGKLGRDATGDAGFDIYSVVRDGTAVRVKAFATLNVGGRRGLYRINLLNGRASLIGGLNSSVVDIAIPLNQL